MPCVCPFPWCTQHPDTTEAAARRWLRESGLVGWTEAHVDSLVVLIRYFRASQTTTIAAELGRKGGAAGTGEAKRRKVDYASLGRKGGIAKGRRKK